MKNMTNRKAFTLIELMVVIVIIAILAAILFPVFSQAKEQGKSASCISNLKQMAAALQLYRDNHDGYTPTSIYKLNADTGLIEKHTYWPAALEKYGLDPKVLKCPTDKGLGDLSYVNNRFLFGFYDCGPGFTAPESGSPSTKFVFLPTRVITFAEGENTDSIDPEPFGGIDDVISRRSGWFNYRALSTTADTRHNGKGNYAFWDGHVETLAPKQIGRDSAGGGGSSIQQSTPTAFNAGALAGCANNSPAVKDTEPWWGPGVVAGQLKAGAGFSWATAYTDIFTGTTPTNVWGQCTHSFKFALNAASGGARNDFWGHDPEWYWGLGSDGGPYPNNSWWACVVDDTHPRGTVPYGSMPTFNRSW